MNKNKKVDDEEEDNNGPYFRYEAIHLLTHTHSLTSRIHMYEDLREWEGK